MNWFLFWLFLHILAAVIAFGPTFVFPIIGRLLADSPQHMRFAVELMHRMETRLVIPLALSMVISGSGLIWVANLDFFHTAYLIVAVVLYFAAVGISLGVLLPNTRKLLDLIGHAEASSTLPASPPQGVTRLVRSSQMFGGITTVLFLAIIFLMIVQPGGVVTR